MQATNVTDSLVTAAQAGDAIAENKLFSKLSARFIGLAKLILGSRYPALVKSTSEMEVEDIVQETMMTISNKYKDIQFEKSFYLWANSVLTNKVRNYQQKKYRKISMEVEMDSKEDGPISKPTGTDFDNKELLEKIEQCIQRMEEVCKKVMLIFFQGGNREDVVKTFPGIPIGTLDNKIYRCRQRLKALLKPEGYTL